MPRLPDGTYQKVRCTAKSATTGEQCKKWAIRGHHVCTSHGGLSPQVRGKAEENIRELILAAAPTAFRTLLEMAATAQSESVRVAAARDLLDRAGHGATSKQALELTQPGQETDLDRDIKTLVASLEARAKAEEQAPEPAKVDA